MSFTSAFKKRFSSKWTKVKKVLLRRESEARAVRSTADETDIEQQETPQICVPVMDTVDGGLTADEHEHAVQDVLVGLKAAAVREKSKMIGFPGNLLEDFSPLDFIGSTKLNNVGDPFVKQDKWGNTGGFEVGVLDWFASLWEIERPHYWGYMTTGGTESIMYSLYTSREEFPNGIVYASEDAHYSVYKMTHILRMPLSTVPSLDNGEIDYIQLKARLIKNLGKPAIIMANIGSTMKGAIDNVEKIVEALKEAGYSREMFHIHCDAALFGVMLPFIEIPCKLSFKTPIDSISVSGHKFLGCPHPCGILIIRTLHRRLIGNSEIIAVPDTTITGSRSGHAPLYMWYILSKKGIRGIAEDVKHCLENAELLKQLLLQFEISAYRNPFSNIVVFEKPKEKEIIKRWHLACVGSAAHVVVMPHTTKTDVEKFASDIRNQYISHQQT